MYTFHVLSSPASWSRNLMAPTALMLALLLCPVAVWGQASDAAEQVAREPEAGEVLASAGTAYDEADYARAAALYLELIEADFDSGDLHYDLGNAQLRNGELGRAIASYRRAAVRRPRDRDVEANLEFARKSTKDALMAPRPSEVSKTLFFWHHSLSRAELATVVVVLNLLFWTSLALRLRRRSEILRWISLVLLVPLVLTGVSLSMRTFWPRQVAVIVPQEISAHTGPESSTVVRFKLHAGTEVRLAERRAGWLRVELPDGQQGWVSAGEAEIVSH